jgi:NADPH:quinone reductase-like Zn-dependent oxidoreductase
MSKINKVVITEFGDESKLAIVEDDLPDPAAGEVQLSVEYSIVSGSDVNMRRGTYPFQRQAPFTPGYSVLGKVRVNGKGCTKFKVGDRVACLSKYEGQAELINLPERFLVRVPDGVDLKAAVSLVLDWVTAYQMLHHSAHIKSPPLGCDGVARPLREFRKAGQTRHYAAALNTPFKNASRSALIVSASVVGMP